MCWLGVISSLGRIFILSALAMNRLFIYFLLLFFMVLLILESNKYVILLN